MGQKLAAERQAAETSAMRQQLFAVEAQLFAEKQQTKELQEQLEASNNVQFTAESALREVESLKQQFDKLAAVGAALQSPPAQEVKIKGICLECQQPVFTHEQRVKCAKGYMHTSCFEQTK